MKGSHGTCATFAEAIKRSGFQRSKSAKRGTGVYFWSYNSNELKSYATELADAWWSFASNTGEYDLAEHKTCCVLHARLSLNGGILLDLERHEVKQRFIKFANDVYKRLVKLSHSDKISSASDLFVVMMEKEENKKVDIVCAAINAPPGFKGSMPFDIVGTPSCYIVRNIACIKSIQFCDGDEIEY